MKTPKLLPAPIHGTDEVDRIVVDGLSNPKLQEQSTRGGVRRPRQLLAFRTALQIDACDRRLYNLPPFRHDSSPVDWLLSPKLYVQ
jgi:hypothetical protein